MDFLSLQKLLASIFFHRNRSSDTRSYCFGAKFLLLKLSANDLSYERKSAFNLVNEGIMVPYAIHKVIHRNKD